MGGLFIKLFSHNFAVYGFDNDAVTFAHGLIRRDEDAVSRAQDGGHAIACNL